MSNLQKSEPQEVISAQAGKLVDRAHVYLSAQLTTEKQDRGYIFLIGSTLLALELHLPGWSSEKIHSTFFKDIPRSRLYRALQFANAVLFLSKGKIPIIGIIADGDRLLTAGELSEREKSELIEGVEKVNKGGVMKTIQAWHNKKNPPVKEPKDELHAHEEKVKNITAGFQDAADGLDFLVQMKDVDFVLANPALRAALKNKCDAISARIHKFRKQS
jgi:hypothetical protein